MPRVSAPPAAAALWHMAQFTRKSSPPSAALPLFVQQVLFGDGRAGPEGSDVSGQLVGLFVVELGGLLVGLRAVHLHGHAAGANLEVNGGSTDAYKRGSVLGAAGTHAVAGGAVGGEELSALFGVACAEAGGGSLGLVDGGGNGVQPTSDEEAHQQQRYGCQWVTSLLRECLHVVVPLFDPASAPGAAS